MTGESKILIIDDNTTSLKFLSELLGSKYELATAECGAEGLKIAERFQPDVILLDVMMPEMDGFQVCEAIRKNELLSTTKILFLSAASQMTQKLKGYEVGGDDYITKPYDRDEVVAKIKVFMRLKYQEEIARSGEALPSEKLLGPLYRIKKDLSQLYYIKAESPYCYVYSDSAEKGVYKLRISIHALEEYFQEKDLLRVHRSYLVNPKKVISIINTKTGEYRILLMNQLSEAKNPVITIGRTYHEAVRSALPRLFPS